MSLDDVIDRNKSEFTSLKVQYKILDHQYDKTLQEYRNECYNSLVDEYKWPAKIAKVASKLIRVPKKKKALADYIKGLTIGNLPNRFVEPIAKCSNTDRQFYTKLSIISDVGSLALAATTMWGVNFVSNYSQGMLEQTYNFIGLGENIINGWLLLNGAVRLLALPYRIYQHKKGNHTPSYASMCSPNPAVLLGFNTFVLYDFVQSRNEKKLDSPLKNIHAVPRQALDSNPTII